MIDPIGLVGTLIAVIQVCNKIVSACYEYRNGIRDASSDISRILEETSSIGSLAERLLKTAEADHQADLPSLQSLNEAENPLRRCLTELVDLKTTLKLGKKVGLRSTLMWPLKRPEAERRLLAIERAKTTLQLALSADNAQNMIEVLCNVRSLPSIGKQVSSLVQQTEETSKRDKRNECLRWLGGHNQLHKHWSEVEKGTNGTGNWLLQHDTYRSWKSKPGQLVWLNGIAGCGKTVLCAKLINDLQNHCGVDESVGLTYFYIDGSDPKSLGIEDLYRSCLSQLASRKRSLPSHLDSLYSQYGPGGYRTTTQTVSAEKLRKALHELLRHFDHTYIALDALDEAEDSIGLEKITAFLKDIWSKIAAGTVHLAIFSRDLERLRNLFQELGATSIAVDGNALDLDLQVSLQHQLCSHPKFARWPVAVKKSVEKSLLTHANGSFRWLDCQLQTLRNCATPAAVRMVLSDLPKSLEVYYTRVLEGIDESNRLSVRNLLRWVTFAFRPLSLSELASAIAINAEDGDAPFCDENLELLDPDSFVDSCSSLVTTYSEAKDPSDTPAIYVKLAHFTVKEFLVSDAIRGGSGSTFAMNIALAHAYIAKSSLAYFRESAASADDFRALNSLTGYAGHFWLRHKNLSGQTWTSKELRHLVFGMFDEKDGCYRHWLEVADIDRPWLMEDSKRPEDYTPLYCAAYHGESEITQLLLNKGASPNEPAGLYGNPLQAAARNGHLDLVRALLHANADPNLEGGMYETALAAAADGDHLACAKELLGAGASVQFSLYGPLRDRRSDPLFLAVRNGNLALCQLLLDHGAKDYFQMKARPGSSLHAAAQSGRLDIVKVLLQSEQVRHANSHEAGCGKLIRPASSGIAASQYYAAAYGHADILRELLSYGITKDQMLRYAARAGDRALVFQTLDQGATLDSPGSVSDHPRALQSAALGGHVELVRELLARGADASLMSDYSTALSAAIRGGNLEIVKILIDAGADVNPSYPYVLGTAIYECRKDLVELLVKHGSDMHRALRDATARADLATFQMLLKLGADIHHRDPGDETSILGAAAWGGSTAIVQYLLDNGLRDQLNPEPGETTPLMEAIHTRRQEVVYLLLVNGADVNALPPLDEEPGPSGGAHINGSLWPPQPACETALTLAIKRQHSTACNGYGSHGGIARALMQHGALVSPNTPVTVGTPLLHAAWEEEEDLVTELLERGADPSQRGTVLRRGKPTFPLLLAAEKGNVAIISRLIEAGAKVDDQDAEGFTALYIAAACDNTEALKVLLEQHHANFNMRLQNGSQPIHSAASKGTPNHIRILLDAGADVDDKNDDGRTPLHWAAWSGNWDAVEFLLDRGANAKAASRERGLRTVLEMAYVARQKGWYERGRDLRKEWDDEREDELLQRLKQATIGT